MSLNEKEKTILSKSIVDIVMGLEPDKKRIVLTLIPENAKKVIGI